MTRCAGVASPHPATNYLFLSAATWDRDGTACLLPDTALPSLILHWACLVPTLPPHTTSCQANTGASEHLPMKKLVAEHGVVRVTWRGDGGKHRLHLLPVDMRDDMLAAATACLLLSRPALRRCATIRLALPAACRAWCVTGRLPPLAPAGLCSYLPSPSCRRACRRVTQDIHIRTLYRSPWRDCYDSADARWGFNAAANASSMAIIWMTSVHSSAIAVPCTTAFVVLDTYPGARTALFGRTCASAAGTWAGGGRAIR